MSIITEIFEKIAQYNIWVTYFTTEEDLNNIQAMSRFVEENSLEGFIIEDEGTTALIALDGYDFKVALHSSGIGDCFTHVIEAERVDA